MSGVGAAGVGSSVGWQNEGFGVLTRRTFLIGAGALTVGVVASAAGAARPAWDTSRWPGGAQAAVSLTYDDGLDSQLDNAIPQLDAFGLKATFFLTRENMEARVDDWVAVAKRGHEIADHTDTHPCRLKRFDSASFEREQIAPAEAFFDQHFGVQHPRDFAFPCGFVGLGKGGVRQREQRYRRVLEANFLAARTVDGDPNNPKQVARRRYMLNGFEPTYEADSPHPAAAYVAKAVDHGYWAILIFHEVLERRLGEGDTSKAVHRQILEALMRQPVWCAPMAEVLSTII